MKYLAVATDYDGTLASYGQVSEETLGALALLQTSGRRLILVTGRQLDDLLQVFPNADLFDRIVAENGAVIYNPSSGEQRCLAAPPPEVFVKALEEKTVDPLYVGQVVIATLHPHEQTVLEVIRDLGLELQVIFNKGSVMVLPAGVNKATGLVAAVRDLGLSIHNVVAIGDAENDHAFLTAAHCGVAVAGALPMLKETADWVTLGDNGAGVRELIAAVVEEDLDEVDRQLVRHLLPLGSTVSGDQELRFQPLSASILVAGPSGSGKTTAASGILETLINAGYQICIIDPEGDYETFERGVVLGTHHKAPAQQEVLQLLENPEAHVVVNLVGVKLDDRPSYFASLLPRIHALRARTGRPHWIFIDEAHHLLPINWEPALLTVPQQMDSVLLITVHPDQVSPEALKLVDTVMAVGDRPEETLASYGRAAGVEVPPIEGERAPGQVVVWQRNAGTAPVTVKPVQAHAERRRHQRKYAEGDLGPDRSFYFRGPGDRLNLRAQNLLIFAQLAEGLDDETWTFHLRRGDYSAWFREKIKDPHLADTAAAIEQQANGTPQGTREGILSAIRERYTLPATVDPSLAEAPGR